MISPTKTAPAVSSSRSMMVSVFPKLASVATIQSYSTELGQSLIKVAKITDAIDGQGESEQVSDRHASSLAYMHLLMCLGAAPILEVDVSLQRSSSQGRNTVGELLSDFTRASITPGYAVTQREASRLAPASVYKVKLPFFGDRLGDSLKSKACSVVLLGGSLGQLWKCPKLSL